MKLNNVLLGVIGVLVAILGYQAMSTILDMPDVMVSNSTKECVEVINYGDTDWSCDNLPSKYNHIWVK